MANIKSHLLVIVIFNSILGAVPYPFRNHNIDERRMPVSKNSASKKGNSCPSEQNRCRLFPTIYGKNNGADEQKRTKKKFIVGKAHNPNSAACFIRH